MAACADPSRLLRPTEALLHTATGDVPSAAGAQAARPFAPLHGYTEKQLELDRRYKLSAALHGAGLAGVRAARSLLLGG